MKEEAKIERVFNRMARAKGAIVIKLHGNGWPDSMVLYKGGVIFIEFKSPTGKLSKIQQVIHQQFAESGNKVHVIRSAFDAYDLVFGDEL